MPESVNISLSPIEKVFDVSIESTRPMLMHSTASMMLPKNPRGVNPTPEQEAENALYKNKDGKIIIPALNIIATMKAAASDFKVGGKGKKTFKQYIDSGIDVLPDDPLLVYDKWEIDARPVVIQRSRIIRSRPKFDSWKLDFKIQVIDPLLLDANHDGSILKDILEAAGKHKGLGDFRPRFGQFRVTKFEASE